MAEQAWAGTELICELWGFLFTSDQTHKTNPEFGWPQASPMAQEAAPLATAAISAPRLSPCLSPLTPSSSSSSSRFLAGARCDDFARFCFCCAKMLNWSFRFAQQRQAIAALGAARGVGGAQPVGISLIQTEEKPVREIRLCLQLPFHHC